MAKPPIEWRKGSKTAPSPTVKHPAEIELERRRALKAAQMRRYRAKKADAQAGNSL